MTIPDMLIAGSLTLDNVLTADGTRLPQSAGGNVVYAALGAALWGGRVGLVSRAGADFSAPFLAMLRDRGLDLGGVTRIDAPHGMNVAFAYRRDGSRVRTFPAEVMARIPQAERPRFTDYTSHGPVHRYAVWTAFAPDAGDIPAAWRDGSGGAHLAAMPVQRHLSLAASLREAEASRPLHVDSPWYDERALDLDFHTALLRDADLLLPSDADLTIWRPTLKPEQAAAELARATGRRILVKRGSAGCALIGADGAAQWSLPVCPVDAMDPTGAGDAFCGGVLAGLLVHGDLCRAAMAGTVSASFAVAAPGISGLLTASRAEAERRLAQLADQVSISGAPV